MRPLPLALGLSLLSTGALADGALTAPQLDMLITGNTLYVQVPAGAPGAPDGGTAPIFYSTDGAAAARLPAGLTLVGTWAMEGNRYCIDWDNGPKNSCSQLSRTKSGFVILDVKEQAPRGVVTHIAVGNPENL